MKKLITLFAFIFMIGIVHAGTDPSDVKNEKTAVSAKTGYAAPVSIDLSRNALENRYSCMGCHTGTPNRKNVKKGMAGNYCEKSSVINMRDIWKFKFENNFASKQK